jgi:Phosphodiester glycosidase
VSTSTAFKRAVACVTVLTQCAFVAMVAAPRAQADPRQLLLEAIANTRGQYLVYNFGGQFAAPFRNAVGDEYTLNNGGHLVTIKNASARVNPRLLVDTHTGAQARCEHNPKARTSDGTLMASETYTPLEAWQALGEPPMLVNGNFGDDRPQLGGSWRETRCISPQGTYVDNTHGLGRTNQAVTGTIPFAGKKGLGHGGPDPDSALTTMIIPVGGAPYVIRPKNRTDYDVATPEVANLVNQGARFVAVAGIGLLAPDFSGQLNDGGPIAARTAVGYNQNKDELYVFEGGSYTPDNMQDLFRELGSDRAVLLDGGGSSAIVLRRDTGGMWSGAGSPRGSCDTVQALCDSRERDLGAWLAFN